MAVDEDGGVDVRVFRCVSYNAFKALRGLEISMIY